MTERIRLDDMTDDQLDDLYDRLASYENDRTPYLRGCSFPAGSQDDRGGERAADGRTADPCIIRAPWTPEQVDALNQSQRAGGIPFTCGDHTPGSPTLVAHTAGFRCPEPYGEPCDYTQDWAHAFMADPARLPGTTRRRTTAMPITNHIVIANPQPEPHPDRYTHTDVDGDRLLITTAGLPGGMPGVYFQTDREGSTVPLDDLPALIEQLRVIADAAREAAEDAAAEGEPTLCCFPPCDTGPGEPCDRHEREQAHAEGEHELCGSDCPAAPEGGAR